MLRCKHRKGAPQHDFKQKTNVNIFVFIKIHPLFYSRLCLHTTTILK